MNTPETPAAPVPSDAQSDAPAGHQPVPRAPKRRRWLRWALGVLAALALALLLALIALWVWAGREGSLARALQLAERYVQISSSEVSGSLRHGGQIGQLQWQDGQGLRVQVRQLHWRWHLGEMLGRHLHITQLSAAQLQVWDQRPPQPDAPRATEPPALALPLRITLDSLHIGHAQWADQAEWAVHNLQARYRYEGGQHQLHVPQVHVASGHYQLRAQLNTQEPLQTELALGGSLLAPATTEGSAPLPVTVQALLHGPLRDLQARADVRALPPADPVAVPASGAAPARTDESPQPVLPDLPDLPNATWAAPPLDADGAAPPADAPPHTAPRLQASARVQPWAAQPLPEAHAQLQALDIAALWPDLPRTVLNGAVALRPQAPAIEGGASGWVVQAGVRNTLAGPWDKALLPLETLQANVLWQDGVASVHQLQALLGGGQLQASGRWLSPEVARLNDQQWQVQAGLEGINPARLHSQLAPDAWAGQAQVSGQGPAIHFEADIQGQRARVHPHAGLRLQALRTQGDWANGLLTLQQLQLQAADAQLQAKATLRLMGDAQQPLGGQAQLRLTAPGTQAQAEGELWAERGQGQLKAQVQDAARTLAWLRKLPGMGDALAAHSASGSAQLQGQWRGGWKDPTVDLRLNTPTLAWWPSRQPDDKLQLSQTDVRLQGRLQQAQLNVRTQLLMGQRELAFEGVAQGGRSGRADVPLAQSNWQLTLAPFSLHIKDEVTLGAGVWQARSEQAVALRWSPAGGGRLDVGAGGISLHSPAPATQARLDWSPARWQAGQLHTSGRLSQLPMQWIERVAGDAMRQAGVGGDVVFNGEWDAQLGRDLKLRATLERASGDITISAPDSATGRSTQVRAGLRQARLTLENQGPQLNLQLHWDSERAGQINALLGTTLAASGSGDARRWHWPADAAVQGTLTAQLPQVAVWSVLAPPGWRLRGSLSADWRLSGTRSQPLLHGSLNADDLGMRSVVDGVALRDGRLRARLDGQRLLVDEFLLHGSGAQGGTLHASGAAQLTDGQLQANLNLVLNQLRASIREDRQVTVSGRVETRYMPGSLSADGQLKVDRALIVLPDESRPSLGPDVVVRGQPRSPEAEKPAPDKTAPTEGKPLQARVNVQVNLGEDFRLRGMGIDTRLAGALTLAANGPLRQPPRLTGSVRTEGGRFRAYGQQLLIAHGRIHFDGEISNPRLDILALRPNYTSDQQVGVQVLGTALLPRVNLYSNPALSETQTLAWLLLGREAPSTGAEAAMLQAAALSLLGGRQSKGLAANFGLDELSVSGGEDGTVASASVKLGKRLSDRLYAAYEHSLGGVMGVLMIYYEFSRSLTLRAQAGQTQAIDLLYRFSFD